MKQSSKNKMFWIITIVIIVITLVSLPLILSDTDVLSFFVILWLVEAYNIYHYVKAKRK